jgi:hypothetical protein
MVYSLGFRVSGLGLKDQEFRVQGLGFRPHGIWCLCVRARVRVGVWGGGGWTGGEAGGARVRCVCT